MNRRGFFGTIGATILARFYAPKVAEPKTLTEIFNLPQITDGAWINQASGHWIRHDIGRLIEMTSIYDTDATFAPGIRITPRIQNRYGIVGDGETITFQPERMASSPTMIGHAKPPRQ